MLGGVLAEVASFRSVILLGASARIGTRLLLLFGTTVRQQQLMQVLYSFGSAAEVLFFAFAYVITPPSRYGRVTAAVQGTYWGVHVLAAGTGDMLLHLAGISLSTLVVLSSVGIALSVVWGAVLLPSEVALQDAEAGENLPEGLQHLLMTSHNSQENYGRHNSAWSAHSNSSTAAGSPLFGAQPPPAVPPGASNWELQRAASGHYSPVLQPASAQSLSTSFTPWELDRASLNSSSSASVVVPHGAAPRRTCRHCCAQTCALLICRTAWVEVCCSKQQLYGTDIIAPKRRTVFSDRCAWVLAVLRRVYSSSSYVPLLLWWTLAGDPMFQNVRNYESSLYDALLPSASTGMSCYWASVR